MHGVQAALIDAPWPLAVDVGIDQVWLVQGVVSTNGNEVAYQIFVCSPVVNDVVREVSAISLLARRVEAAEAVDATGQLRR
jgi:hypothetical protein